MATLKMGSTTMLTESSGALTINASNPTVTLGSNTTFPAGHIINAVLLTDTNRHVLANSDDSPASTADFGSYTKLLASSTLHFISTVVGHDDASGVTGLGIRYGSGTISYTGSWTYNDAAYIRLLQCQMALVGHTTTGAQNVEMVHKAASNVGTSPCVVTNPTTSDEGRYGGMYSTCIVYEIAT